MLLLTKEKHQSDIAGTSGLNKHDTLGSIVDLRRAVGLLGEKEHSGWWSSLWFTSHAVAFLTPVFGGSTDAARYNGVVQAARHVHDSRIGVGRAFHLFRLPESLERTLHDAVTGLGAPVDRSSIQTKEDAEAFLSKVAGKVEPSAGPIRVGSERDLESAAWLGTVAGHYLAGFQAGHQTFPYFAEGL